MAGPPPRKRQKRLVVSSSSEDEEGDACRDDITGNGDHTTVDPCTGLEIISSASLTAKTTRRGTVRDQKKRSQRAPSSTTSSFLSTASTTSNTRSRTQTRKQTTLPVLLSPQGSRTAAAPRSILPSSSPASSPEKCKPRARKTADNGNGSSKATTGNKDTRSVRTFFQPATEQQRWDRTERARSVTSTGTGTKAAEDQQAASWWEGGDDLIEDDGIDEIFENLARNGHGMALLTGRLRGGWEGMAPR
jgi:cell cycle checkpoint protein